MGNSQRGSGWSFSTSPQISAHLCVYREKRRIWALNVFRGRVWVQSWSSLLKSQHLECCYGWWLLEILGSCTAFPPAPSGKWKNHVLAAGKKQCGRAGVGLRNASHGPSLLWIFGVRFEDSDCFLLAWKAFKQIKNCISYSMMLRRKSVSKWHPHLKLFQWALQRQEIQKIFLILPEALEWIRALFFSFWQGGGTNPDAALQTC